MRRPSILVVDDDEDVLEMTDCFFREAGVEVRCVKSGAKALEKIRENGCTVMLTDYNMPGMNGLELAEKAREIAPQLRIVMFTGTPSRELSDLAAKAGIATVMEKPLRIEGLFHLVDEVINPASS